jgi:hypothetical protein
LQLALCSREAALGPILELWTVLWAFLFSLL